MGRDETEEYWCGLKKLNGGGWYATRWYNFNPSTYRDWSRGYPKNWQAECVLFTLDGWKDELCDTEFYFVCKTAGKPASACSNRRHRIHVLLPVLNPAVHVLSSSSSTGSRLNTALTSK